MRINFDFRELKRGNPESMLRSLLFNADLQDLIRLNSFFLGPTLNFLYYESIQALFSVFNQDFYNLLILFGVFISLMLLVWPLTVCLLVKRLTAVQRSARIKVKLIPSKALIKIKEKGNKSSKGELNDGYIKKIE